MLFLWLAACLSFYGKPSNRNIAFVFFAALLASLTHFLEAIMLIALYCAIAGMYLIASKGKEKIRKLLLISLAGSAPSIIFWAPFIADSNKSSIIGTAFSGYIWLIGGLFLLMIAGLFIMQNRSAVSALLAFLLIAYGLGKVAYFPPQLQDDFKGLQMDGKYFALQEVSVTVYSVLAARGFKSAWGNYDPAASSEQIEKYYATGPDCKSLEEFAKYSNAKNVVASSTNLSECGFIKIYSGRLSVFKIP